MTTLPSQPETHQAPKAPSGESRRLAPHPVLTKYYEKESDRRARIDNIFDAGARHYDTVNRMMSFGSGHRYRKQALLRAGLREGMSHIDVGCGTGVIAAHGQDIVGPTGRVVAVDPSRGMREEAKRRGVNCVLEGIAEKLPVEDDQFDLLTMGYALRHVADLHDAFREYSRVLKPGGRMLILEISPPKSRISYSMLKFYLKTVVPTMSRIFVGRRDAQEMMSYYWDTIEQCVDPETILAAMRDVGLTEVERHVELKVFSEFMARKAES